VLFGVVTAGLGMMLLGVAGMAVRAVGVVGGLLMVAGFMMPGGFAVMLGRVPASPLALVSRTSIACWRGVSTAGPSHYRT
jgi:hypothetical protein